MSCSSGGPAWEPWSARPRRSGPGSPKERGSSVPGASALTAAELRLLPLLATHLSFPEIAAELFLSPHTVKSEMKSVYRKLGASTRNQAVIRARELGSSEGDGGVYPIGGMEPALARSALVLTAGRRMDQTAGFQETLRRLAIFDEEFVPAGSRPGLAELSALDARTVALLQVAVSVAIGSSAVCLQWSAARAMAAGATKDEIADVLLAIAPVAGLGRVVSAAPKVATALEYDVEAALGEPNDH